jgi:transposase
MRKVVFFLLIIILVGCKTKKVEKVETITKEVFIDTGSIKTITLTEYYPFYDTINKVFVVYPKTKKEIKKEKKSIIKHKTEDKKESKKEVEQKTIYNLKLIFWLIAALIISLFFNLKRFI